MPIKKGVYLCHPRPSEFWCSVESDELCLHLLHLLLALVQFEPDRDAARAFFALLILEVAVELEELVHLVFEGVALLVEVARLLVHRLYASPQGRQVVLELDRCIVKSFERVIVFV